LATTYFTFITGLTIGYGDLVPRLAVSRALSVVIGIIGALVMALFAAVSPSFLLPTTANALKRLGTCAGMHPTRSHV